MLWMFLFVQYTYLFAVYSTLERASYKLINSQDNIPNKFLAILYDREGETKEGEDLLNIT